MKKKVLKKLKSRGGETIAEVLVALLISALGLTMLAGVISASGRIVLGSMDKMGKYVSSENQIVSYTAGDPVSSSEGTATLSLKKTDGSESAWKLTDQTTDTAIKVIFYSTKVLGNKPVVSYRVK